MKLTSILIALSAITCSSQSLSEQQQKALNNAVEFLNNGSEEINGAVSQLKNSYNAVDSHQKNDRVFVQAYKCNIELKDYYYQQAITGTASLGKYGNDISSKLKSTLEAYQEVVKACQSLEVYFRLQDFKTDNYKKYYDLINDLQRSIDNYDKSRNSCWETIYKTFTTLQPGKPGDPSSIAWRLMVDQVNVEKSVLDSWKINLNESIHTGWPVEMLKKQVIADDKNISTLIQKFPTVKYPASSQVDAFKSGLTSIQEAKRNGIDEYTFENQKSDQHSNRVHDYLLNYYNGVLIPHFNQFVKYASQDGFRGIYLPAYLSAFEIRTKEETRKLEVESFKDIPHSPLSISKSGNVMPANVYQSLTLYVDYINEGVRQFKNCMQSVRNLNGSAGSAKKYLMQGRTVNLSYYDKDFEVPVTLYQQVIESAKSLPSAYQQSLRAQADILQAILVEWSQWSNVLLDASEKKTLNRDSLAFAFGIVERYKELIDTFDKRKEQLYEDVRAIYDSYAKDNPSSSWSKSGIVLLKLVDLDKQQLYVAREFYSTNPNAKPDTKEIDELLRTIITDEYTNMKGIQKYGRNNGLCPYTPYEDIPETSRTYSEKLNHLAPSDKRGYSHPYHNVVYLFNEIVDDYNKFCELSREVRLLDHVKQFELFEVEYPDFSDLKKEATQLEHENPRKGNEPVMKKPENSSNVPVSNAQHTRDTIYMERVDTVYLHDPSENLHSMEGYAANNMVLLLDVSGSMNAPDKLPLLKQTLLNMLGMMREEDEVSVVVYSGNAKVLLQPVSFKQGERIKKVIGGLKSSGKTDVDAGLKLAYQVADKNYIRGGNNRIILATDGEFPVSDDNVKLIEQYAGEDIFISVFNFGKGNSAARNLEKLATVGKGNYELITPENAEFKLIQEAKSKRKK